MHNVVHDEPSIRREVKTWVALEKFRFLYATSTRSSRYDESGQSPMPFSMLNEAMGAAGTASKESYDGDGDAVEWRLVDEHI
jgi:hypothetical protein